MVSYEPNELNQAIIFGLNPCCSGRWSRTALVENTEFAVSVLILVVVEDGLVRNNI